MEEIERVAKEKYDAIKEKLPQANNETIAILMAINALSTQLSREIDFDKKEEELEKFRTKELSILKDRAQRSGAKK